MPFIPPALHRLMAAAALAAAGAGIIWLEPGPGFATRFLRLFCKMAITWAIITVAIKAVVRQTVRFHGPDGRRRDALMAGATVLAAGAMVVGLVLV